MIETYTVVDVETPNGKNDSICQIGVKCIRGGKEVFNDCALINPEATFDNINMQIHKITPQMVEDAPTIKEYWQNVSDYFKDTIIVGHNIKFDLCVLTKALNKYNITLPAFSILCTMQLAANYLPLQKNTLSNICEYLEIPVGNAHNAGADVEMCYLVLNKLGEIIPSVYSEVSIYEYCPQNDSPRTTGSRFNTFTKSIIELKQVVESIMEDGIIEKKEVWALEYWLSEHEELFGYYPYDIISSTLYSILEDGIITRDEYEKLETVLKEFLNPIEANKSFNNVCIDGKSFCLTGDFKHGERSIVEELLVSKGGIKKTGVSGKLDYLIVGDKGSQAWKFGNYGGKVQKAMEFKEKGSNIQIISESDFFLDL